jgi:hypothetical protein
VRRTQSALRFAAWREILSGFLGASEATGSAEA